MAKLIGHCLFLQSEEKVLLCAASLLHHHGAGLRAPQSLQKLLADVTGQAVPAMEDSVPGLVRQVLLAYQAPGSGGPLAAKLAAILRLAEAFDEGMEAQPITGESVSEILAGLADGAAAGLWPQTALEALREAARGEPGPPESWRVPVFPQAALRMLALMRDPRASMAQTAQAASLDPATAGMVMQLANSALFGARMRIATLQQAIARLGMTTAQKVILSAALRPVFGGRRLERAWPHSLEVADLAEQLAARSGALDPAEAYLAGLVHDAGRIARLAAPLYDSARIEGLEKDGCPPVYAEEVVLGCDHGVPGARIAADWRLPEEMASAIGFHHRPEKADGPLAPILYLAEFLSGSEEDLPSAVRLDGSLRRLGIGWQDLEGCKVSALGCWLAAA